MAGFLVGSVGAVATAGAGVGITPAWGTGEGRSAGNLLILWVAGGGSTSFPSAPTGWSSAMFTAGPAGSITGSIFYRTATGADAAPTVAAPAGGQTILFGQLAEFGGMATSSPADRAGNGNGTTSPLTCFNSNPPDATSGELLLGIGAANYTATTGTKTMALTSNHATLNSTTNQGGTLVNVYDFAWGFTSTNSSADSIVNTYSTTRIFGACVGSASFKLFSSPPAPPPAYRNQAVNRSVTFFTRIPWKQRLDGLLVPPSRKLILG